MKLVSRFLLLTLGILLLISHVVFAEQVITIGCPLSTSFLYGRNAERGITLAIEEINEAGGINLNGVKFKFKADVMDTRDLEPTVPVSSALSTVKKLILDKKVDFLIGGPVRSEAALASMDLVNKHKIIAIQTVGALTPKFHKTINQNYDSYKYSFKMHTDAEQIVEDIFACFRLLQEEHGLNKIFLLIQDVAHARAASELVKMRAPELGFNVVGVQAFPTGCQTYDAALRKVRFSGAEILSIWMDMPESLILLKQLRIMQIKAIPFGSTLAAAEHPSYQEIMGKNGNFTLCNVITAGNAPSKATAWTMRFYEAYTERWGVEPEGFGCSSSYMAPYVLKAAIESAGTLDADIVIKALEEIDIIGVYGRIRFDPNSHQVIFANDPSVGAVGSIIQWQNGKRIVVYPQSIATGNIRLP